MATTTLTAPILREALVASLTKLSPRQQFRNPINQSHDLALFKNFHFRERMKLQFRAEMFNFLNHPNFNGPNTNINDNNAIETSFTS